MRCEIGKLVRDVTGMKQSTGNTANDITLTRGERGEACEGQNKSEREQKQACDADKNRRDEITEEKGKEMRDLNSYTGARVKSLYPRSTFERKIKIAVREVIKSVEF